MGCLGYLALEEHAVGTPCARQGAELKPGGWWRAACPPAGVDTFLVRFRVPLRTLALGCVGLKEGPKGWSIGKGWKNTLLRLRGRQKARKR